jgi:hypothetical protein
MRSRHLAVLLLGVIACGAPDDSGFPTLEGPYLGQKTPGRSPEVFAPGILNTETHGAFCTVFSPDGDEFHFTRYDKSTDGPLELAFMKRVDNTWTKPVVASFNSQGFSDGDNCMSYDGEKMFFRSWRPLPGNNDAEERSCLWFAERTNQRWTDAEPVLCGGSPVRAGYPSVAENGTLYFPARLDDAIGASDIYRARLADGEYGAPEHLGGGVNTEYIEGDMFVARDESYIIVSVWNHPENVGGDAGDIYVSFQRSDGTWTESANMGPLVNTECGENCPMVSPDGKYLFFNRYCEKTQEGNIFWLDAKIIEEFRSEQLD